MCVKSNQTILNISHTFFDLHFPSTKRFTVVFFSGLLENDFELSRIPVFYRCFHYTRRLFVFARELWPFYQRRNQIPAYILDHSQTFFNTLTLELRNGKRNSAFDKENPKIINDKENRNNNTENLSILKNRSKILRTHLNNNHARRSLA